MSGVFFDGILLERPQAVAKVDTRGMAPPSLANEGVAFFVGQADGGIPKVPTMFRSAEAAKDALKSGNLLKAIQIAFDPSATPTIRGASVVYAVRVDPAVQGSLTLKDSLNADVITVKAVDYGALTNNIKVKVEAGTTQGKKVTIEDGNVATTDPARYIIGDNIGTNVSNVDAVIAFINTYSEIVTATKVVTGSDIVANLASTVLAGGTNGTTTSTDWQDAIDALKTYEVNIGSVVTDSSTIHSMLQAHLVDRATGGKRNARGIVGHAAGETLAQIEARRLALNSQYMVLATPGIERNLEGTTQSLSSVFTAAAFVGMACAVSPEMPLTYKYINAVGLETIYTPEELDELHANHLMAVEFVPNRGYRIVDDLVTTSDETYKHLSVNRIYDWLSINTVKKMEDLYVGQPGDEFTASAMKGTLVSDILIPAKKRGLIHDGVDPITGQDLPAYRNIRIESQGEIWHVSFEVSPTEQVGYVLITVYARRSNIVV